MWFNRIQVIRAEGTTLSNAERNLQNMLDYLKESGWEPLGKPIITRSGDMYYIYQQVIRRFSKNIKYCVCYLKEPKDSK